MSSGVNDVEQFFGVGDTAQQADGLPPVPCRILQQ